MPASEEQWSDWRWQFKASLKREGDFTPHFQLTSEERRGFEVSDNLFKVQVTPYYASLADRNDPYDPVRLMFMPRGEEAQVGGQQMPDPLGELKHSPRERIIHRYPDRVLFLVTDICSVYCRYCLRKHFTGQSEAFVGRDDYLIALKYLRESPGIREVILSGGDPLTLSDAHLERLLSDLREIEHIEIIRLATRMPVVAPMRFTKALLERLQKFHPIVVMTHFNHPQELSLEAAQALTLLVDHGFPVFNQMVLLRGVNNHPAIVHALSRRLLLLRTKPYYMFQCDPSLGTDHFRTSIEESLSIQRQLWGRLSGLAMPNLSLDIPGGGGKVGLVPNFIENQSDGEWIFRGWDGHVAAYQNPISEGLKARPNEYLEEWSRLVEQPYGNTERQSEKPKLSPDEQTSPQTS